MFLDKKLQCNERNFFNKVIFVISEKVKFSILFRKKYAKWKAQLWYSIVLVQLSIIRDQGKMMKTFLQILTGTDNHLLIVPTPVKIISPVQKRWDMSRSSRRMTFQNYRVCMKVPYEARQEEEDAIDVPPVSVQTVANVQTVWTNLNLEDLGERSRVAGIIILD